MGQGAARAWRKTCGSFDAWKADTLIAGLADALDALDAPRERYTTSMDKGRPSVVDASGEIVCQCWTDGRAEKIAAALNAQEGKS